jgi:hypothetical protein
MQMSKYLTAMGLLCAAGLGVSAASAQTTITIEKVITNSDPVPTLPADAWKVDRNSGGGGYSLCFSNGGTIDQSGNVVFRGMLAWQGDVVANVDDDIAFYGVPGNLQYLARAGHQAPGMPAGVVLKAFQTNLIPRSANNGMLWVGGTTSTNPYGYITTGPLGGLAKVVRAGDTMPGGDVLDIHANPASTSNYNNVTSSGQTAFMGQIGPAATAVLAAYIGGPGTLQLAYKEGVPYSSLPSGGMFDTNHNNGGLGMLFFNGQANIVGSGWMAPTGGIGALNNEVLFTRAFGTPAGTLNVIAHEGDPAPGCGGATYLAEGLVSTGPALTFSMFRGNFNNQNHLIFGDGLQGTGVTSGTNDYALWYHDGASVHLFRRMGDPTTAVPGATYGFTGGLTNRGQYEAAHLALNNSDTVVWATTLTPGVGGVTTSNNNVLLRTALGSSTDTLLVRQGSRVADPATGTVIIPGVFCGSEISGLQQNNAGQLMFIVSLTDDGSGTTFYGVNDHAVMVWDPVQGLMLVYRTGNDISNLVGFQPDTVDLITAHANAEGGSNELSDNGWLVFGVSTAAPGPANSALLRARIPAPPCYANCDGSTTAPVLNVGDFTCFLQKYAAGDPYANCDHSTTPPVLNVGDFTCFLQKYAAGCP